MMESPRAEQRLIEIQQLYDSSDRGEPQGQSYSHIFQQFVWMGWSAFGGPSAHIGLFQKVLVEKLSWLSSTLFLELLALCQLMPGPTSTQMSFAIGITQRGASGGLLSGLLFQFPGLLLASLAGIGAANFLKHPAPWLQGCTSGGLAAVGVALVASAAKTLTYNTCKSKLTMAVNAAAVAIVYYYHPTWIFPVLLLAGGLVTILAGHRANTATSSEDVVQNAGLGCIVGSMLILLWIILLAASTAIRQNTSYSSYKVFHWFETFYRIGSLIFGGGQVVLPMLDSDVVQAGWVSESDFLTGIALVQAMPGPLFNIAAYTGAIIAANAHAPSLVGIAVCWVGLFAPGILLIFGAMPWWIQLRKCDIYRRALPGINAAAVGLIVAAVFQLGFKVQANSPFPDATVGIGVIGYALVDALEMPAPLVVCIGGVLGVLGWACHLH